MAHILGIVNLTRDSFSDGGRYLDPVAALAHARALLADGAAAVDLGPASSHPDSAPVSAEEELARLAPVVGPLLAEGASVSIDSWRPETQRWALTQGVAWLNDIRGFPDPAIYPDLAAGEAGLIAMFSVQSAARADRREVDPAQIVDRIEAFFDARIAALTAAGVARERIVIDPGMGFFLGARPEASRAALRAVGRFKRRWGLPVMISVSRKSFLRAVCGSALERIGPATLAAELYAVRAGADWIRTHDARALADAQEVESWLETGG